MLLYEYACENSVCNSRKKCSTMDGWNVSCSTCGEESARVIPLFPTSSKKAADNIISLAGSGRCCTAGGTCI